MPLHVPLNGWSTFLRARTVLPAPQCHKCDRTCVARRRCCPQTELDSHSTIPVPLLVVLTDLLPHPEAKLLLQWVLHCVALLWRLRASVPEAHDGPNFSVPRTSQNAPRSSVVQETSAIIRGHCSCLRAMTHCARSFAAPHGKTPGNFLALRLWCQSRQLLHSC